jgi:putative RecB family exonuclease
MAIQSDLLHVSASQVSTYLLCPERFRLQYVARKQPSHKSADLVFGSAIHEALAWYHQRIKEDASSIPDITDLREKFQQFLETQLVSQIPILWDDADSFDRLQATGHSLLDEYAGQTERKRVLAVETEFNLPLFDPATGRELEERLVGVVDLVEEDHDGTIWITELKTAARRFEHARLAYDRQATTYFIARVSLGFPTAQVRFRVLTKTKKPTIETYPLKRDQAQVDETKSVFFQVLRAVNAGIFFPQRGWQCSTCPFRVSCGS